MNYRLKVEKHIKRKLLKSEEIHHKDGNQHNNRLSNLQIVNGQSEHRMLDKQVKVNWKSKLNSLTKNIIHPIKITDYLSVFFTDRQQYIIYRKINNLVLSKTEREYYSRIIRPKLKAIANPQLFQISQQLIWEIL